MNDEAPRPDDASAPPPLRFEEAGQEEQIPPEILNRRICDFDLRIEGRPLETVVKRFLAELEERQVTHLRPRFYLSDEWGVPEGTVAIGIPFYLADARLLEVQRARGGLVEGTSEEDILRYLRHEMGHVVNYAWRLYESEEWTRLFGPMSRPYPEAWRQRPFHPDYVRYLPGGYAQRHPDEDWSETFAAWLDPGSGWREEYEDAPVARAKLEYCERVMAELRDREPEVTETEADVVATEMKETVQEYFEEVDLGTEKIPRSLDGDLRMIFAPRAGGASATAAASRLLRERRESLSAVVYAWTGVDPADLAPLFRHLSRRAAQMHLHYRTADHDEVLTLLTAFLTTLAMNRVHTGSFLPR